jgi:hypothetical protein
MTKVFVSYSHAESPFAHQLRAALVDAGHEVWLDVDQIQPTDEWLTLIESALEQAEAVVFVVTPEFFRSGICMHELRRATAHGKWRLALIRGGVDDQPLPSELEGTEAIDSHGPPDFRAVLTQLARTV